MKHLTIIKRQDGASLFIGLIMLVVLTLATVVAFNLSKGSLQIVGNMQHRNEVIAAANAVAEEAMSSTRLYTNPSSVLINPCNVLNTRCVDLNNDGITDITVTLTPQPFCVTSQAIKNYTLVLSDPNDAGCAVGASQSTGIVGSDTGNSLCSAATWEINAQAVDKVTQTTGIVTLGVATRADSSCP